MFRWPFAGLLKRMGGIPVNRRLPTGFIGQIVEEFRRRDWLWIAITPEGTRSRTEYLKSGFYQIALAAGVPLGLGYIDYSRRRVAIDTYVRMTGDKDKDLQVLRDFYADKRGRRHEHAGQIRFRD
jgi:1-acyl-sn-glycerol-3-phosphate acyltransferase